MMRNTAVAATAAIACVALARPAAAPAPATPALSPTDYIEIQQLVARYGYALDTGAPEGTGGDYAGLFTSDGAFEGPGIAPGTQGSGKLAALARIPPGSRTRRGPTYVSHFMMNHLIEPTPDGAVGVVYALIVNRGDNGQPNTISMGGHYDDVYARTPNGWRFKKRTFTRGKAALTGTPLSLASAPSRTAREPRAKAGTLTAMDYIEIRKLVSNYAYGLDTGADNGYAYADNFAPGAAVFGNTTGRENIANLARREPHGPAFVRHYLTNVVIEPTPEGARGRQYLSVIDVSEAGKPSSIFLLGKYEDTYVKTPQGWRFKSRMLVRPQAATATAAAPPNRPAPAAPATGAGASPSR